MKTRIYKCGFRDFKHCIFITCLRIPHENRTVRINLLYWFTLKRDIHVDHSKACIGKRSNLPHKCHWYLGVIKGALWKRILWKGSFGINELVSFKRDLDHIVSKNTA